MQPLGQAIDRLERSHCQRCRFVEDSIRMHHLETAIPRLQLSGHPSRLANREELLKSLRRAAEEDQRDVPGLIGAQHPVRCLGSTPGARRMVLDEQLQRHDGPGRGLVQGWPGAPVDDGIWQVEQQVENPRTLRSLAKKPFEPRCNLRPHAWKRVSRGEERVQKGWSHRSNPGVGLTLYAVRRDAPDIEIRELP